MPSALRPSVTAADLDEWCRSLAGFGVARVVFESGYSSAVFGVEVEDGRHLVVKARPWSPRLVASTDVQRRLFAGGFRCPRVLHGPVETNGIGVTIEDFVRGEPMLDGDEAAVPLAVVLADLVARAPAPSEVGQLLPHYAFLRWPRLPGERLWPPTPEVGIDLNDSTFAVGWIDDLAPRVALSMLQANLPPVVAHGDWWSDNIRWQDGALAAVDDWDSAVALPEAAIAGIAAALFSGGESSLEQSEVFLDAYAQASGHLGAQADRTVAWAAGLWARLVDAKKGLAIGYPHNAERLDAEVSERAVRAGLTR